MSGRNSQLVRIYKILLMLEGANHHGLTPREIAEKLAADDEDRKVTKRTIYRDLQALSEIGFPLTADESAEPGEGAKWRLERTAKITQHLVLSSRELLSLYLARNSLKPLRDTPLYSDIESVFNKIEEKLGQASREYLEELSSQLYLAPTPKWSMGAEPDLLDTVHSSCAEGHVLHVVYASANSQETRERKLGPHYLYFWKGSVYLVAEDLESNVVKTFAVPRMTNARMSDESYEGVRTNPETYFQNGLGIFRGEDPVAVQIRFSPTVAPFAKERSWHPSQKCVNKTDGSAELTFDLALTPDLVQWILSFGPHAEVLKPKQLKDEVLAAAQGIVKLYSGKKAA